MGALTKVFYWRLPGQLTHSRWENRVFAFVLPVKVVNKNMVVYLLAHHYFFKITWWKTSWSSRRSSHIHNFITTQLMRTNCKKRKQLVTTCSPALECSNECAPYSVLRTPAPVLQSTENSVVYYSGQFNICVATTPEYYWSVVEYGVCPSMKSC
jgi:hypothetical protein